jgi:hypothetical protein
MMRWLNDAPTWLSFLAFVVLANAVALGLMLVARRWAAGVGLAAGPPVVNSWATCAGGLCAVLFAFSVVTLWNGWTRAHTNIDFEASAIRLSARDMAVAQRPMLRGYVAATIAEWPRLCGGHQDPAVDEQLAALERAAKPTAAAYADDLFRQLSTLEDLRNQRWLSSNRSIPQEVVVALVVLSLALLAVLALALPDLPAMHVALTLCVATAIGTLFWLVAVLEFPFCGATAIRPDELIAIARAHLM